MTEQQRAEILARLDAIEALYALHGERIWDMPPEVRDAMGRLTDETQDLLASLDTPIVPFGRRWKEAAA
jgi:hypothetical protein